MQAQAAHVAEKLEESETSKKSAVVALYDTHEEAERAVRELQRSGFDMKKLSIVGRDYQTEEDVVGYYTAGDRMKAWGKTGAFWGGLWGCCSGRRSSSYPGSDRCSQPDRSSDGLLGRWKARWWLGA